MNSLSSFSHFHEISKVNISKKNLWSWFRLFHPTSPSIGLVKRLAEYHTILKSFLLAEGLSSWWVINSTDIKSYLIQLHHTLFNENRSPAIADISNPSNCLALEQTLFDRLSSGPPTLIIFFSIWSTCTMFGYQKREIWNTQSR